MQGTGRLALAAALALLALPTGARAHTIAFGYVDQGGGTAQFWIGSYHTPPVPNEGSLTLTGPVGTAGVFDATSTTLPAGLVEGTNYACSTAYTCAGVASWQGTTISGLVGGTYQFDVVGLSTAFWSDDPFLFAFPRSVLITLVPAEPETPAPPDYRLGASTQFERRVGSVLNVLRDGGVGVDFAEVLAGIQALPAARRGEALGQIGYRQTPAQVDLLLRQMDAHLGDVRDRLRSVRMGGGAGPLQAYRFAPAAEGGPGSWRTAGVAPAPAAGEAFARQGLPPVGAAPVDGGAAEAAEERLAVWARGRLLFGDHDATAEEEGFGFDGRGGSAGVDVRLGEDWLVGVAGGVVHTDVDYDGFAGSLDLDTTYASVYASWLPDDAFSLDLVAGYGSSDLETRRVMRFAAVSRRARGDGDADTWAADVEARRAFRLGGVAVAPLVGLAWADTRVDSLEEDGAGAASLRVASQEAESLETRLGAEVYAELGLAGLTLRPHARAAWRHEFEDEARTLSAAFREAPAVPLRLRTADPDRDFAAVSAGLDARLGDRLEAFVRYETVLGLDDWDAHEVTAGFGLRF